MSERDLRGVRLNVCFNRVVCMCVVVSLYLLFFIVLACFFAFFALCFVISFCLVCRSWCFCFFVCLCRVSLVFSCLYIYFFFSW